MDTARRPAMMTGSQGSENFCGVPAWMSFRNSGMSSVGDMSLVGPRPHTLGSTAEGALFWEAVPDYWTRHAMRPGITGLAQVRGLRGATITRSDIEKRVAADLEYINGWSIWFDLKILLQTIRVVLHRNAF